MYGEEVRKLDELCIDLIGLSEVDAGARVATWSDKMHQPLCVRIVNRGGAPSICTQDYRLDRINLTLRDGVVTKATLG